MLFSYTNTTVEALLKAQSLITLLRANLTEIETLDLDNILSFVSDNIEKARILVQPDDEPTFKE